MNDRVRAQEFARQAKAAGGDLAATRHLRREPEQIRRGHARRKDVSLARRELSDGGGIGKAGAE